ncbi:hypothetical protein EH30_02345 [Erythrobacter sp. JL475]|nr:hypothetical protein EH30_02345 [Erythrobacter sp. JL475]
MGEFFGQIYEILRMTSPWRISLQETWTIALLITALLWGGGPEKVAISVWLIVVEFSRYLSINTEKTPEATLALWSGVNWNSFLVDGLLLIGFVGLALIANRRYVFWIAGLQVIAVMGHVVRASTDDLMIFVYGLMVMGPGWLQIFAMTAGQIAHVRRKRGVYADWIWQVRRPVPAPPVS